MRVAVASLACLALTSGAWAQDVRSAEQRAVALHRVLFTGELDPPRTLAQLEAMTELAIAYRNGTGVAIDIDLACSFAFLAAAEIGRTAPGSSLDTRGSDIRALACSEVRDTEVWAQMMGCPKFGITPRIFGIGPSVTVTLDRAGFHIDTPAGTQVHPLGLTCGEILMTVRHVRVNRPRDTTFPSRDFLELTSWVANLVHGDGGPSRTLTWRLIELHPSGAEPTRHETVDVMTEREWAWPTPPVPPDIANGASLRMLTTGEVRWRFERAPDVGTGVIPAAR